MDKIYAFPGTLQKVNETTNTKWKQYHPGMELRDYFAAVALEVFLKAILNIVESGKALPTSKICEDAYTIADRMMEQRKGQ